MTTFWKALANHKPIQRKPIEFRLYYGTDGQVITYSMDEIPGNYILIDAQTFAEMRVDILVVNGVIINPNKFSQVGKLVPDADIAGVESCQDDITLIGPAQRWKLRYYDST